MKKLILIRHGKYGGLGDEHLTPEGQKQIAGLALKLQSIVHGGSELILTSPAVRAVESAEILAEALETSFEEHELLEVDLFYYNKDLPRVLDLIQSRRNKAETIILVTHLEYVRDIPNHFALQEFDVPFEKASHEINKGEAWVIDCKEKTITHIW